MEGAPKLDTAAYAKLYPTAANAADRARARAIRAAAEESKDDAAAEEDGINAYNEELQNRLLKEKSSCSPRDNSRGPNQTYGNMHMYSLCGFEAPPMEMITPEGPRMVSFHYRFSHVSLTFIMSLSWCNT